MIEWLKKLAGYYKYCFNEDACSVEETKPVEKAEVKEPVKETKPAVKKSAPKKKTTKKTVVEDLNAMTKKDLLTLAKTKNVKVKASLKKQEIIDAINAV